MVLTARRRKVRTRAQNMRLLGQGNLDRDLNLVIWIVEWYRSLRSNLNWQCLSRRDANVGCWPWSSSLKKTDCIRA